MNELFRPRLSELAPWVVRWVDILLVAILIYRLFLLVKGARAWQVIGGVVGFLILLLISKLANLQTLNYVLERAALLMPVVLVILFLPELRHGLEGLGKISSPIQKLVSNEPRPSTTRTIDEIVRAMIVMAEERVGALVVIEKSSALGDIAKTGIELDARVSSALLESIFYEGNPLHDGAVIITGDLIIAAACQLPLSESSRLDKTVHMRHRAAVGVTEMYDCVAIVVSEERGSVSWVENGNLRRLAQPSELKEVLVREFRSEAETHVARPKKRSERKAVAKAEAKGK